MKLKLKRSFPRIASENISDESIELAKSLPFEYKNFLDKTNGGFADEFKYAFKTGVPYKTEKVNNPSRTDCVIEFFGISSIRNQFEQYPRDLVKTKSEHEAEDFLPLGVMAIASCIQNSLVCISLRDNDFGQVYYWDWYWQYPWCKDFFQIRIKDVLKTYPNANEILDNPQNESYQKVSDDFNYATILKLADSFKDFLLNLYDAREK